MPALENFLLVLLGGICALFLAVIAVRFFAALKTRRWRETEATILSSETRARRAGEAGPEIVPHIVYEYSAGGSPHRSHQLKARGVPLGASELPHFLSRYPAGTVARAYYNPGKPQEAVLEREPLSLSAERLGCLTIFATAVVLAAVYGLTPLHGLVQRWFPHADNEDVLVLATGLGVFLILFGVMWLWQGMQERRWPTATGTVISSGVESSKMLSAASGGNKVAITVYRANVVYGYDAGGRSYRSRQIRREQISGGEELAQGVAGKYPAGSSVRVHYNPSNPADAVLETSATMGFLVLWALALGMFAVAASVSGYFRH